MNGVEVAGEGRKVAGSMEGVEVGTRKGAGKMDGMESAAMDGVGSCGEYGRAQCWRETTARRLREVGGGGKLRKEWTGGMLLTG